MAGSDYREHVAATLFDTNSRALGLYFRVFDSLTIRDEDYVPEPESLQPGKWATPARLVTHSDVLGVASILRGNPTLTLRQAGELLRRERNVTGSTDLLESIVRTSAQALFLLDFTEPRSIWQSDVGLNDFVSTRIPLAREISPGARSALENQRIMKAWKLRTRFGISFEGTNDLSQHLRLHTLRPTRPTLKIFRYTAFLRAQLDRLEKHGFSTDSNTLDRCLEIGCLPPRLIAETLHSIEDILFPFDDPKSGRILEKLITKHGLDEDCAQHKGLGMFSGEDMKEYRYWGERLAELHRFMQERPPRNDFERWIKWQTSESNAFALALAALLVSIVVGILSLAVAALQCWLAWKAWKEPISNDDDLIAILREIADLLQQEPQYQRRRVPVTTKRL